MGTSLEKALGEVEWARVTTNPLRRSSRKRSGDPQRDFLYSPWNSWKDRCVDKAVLSIRRASQAVPAVVPASAGDLRPRLDPWVRRIPARRKWQPASVFLPVEYHGRRSLVGYAPEGCNDQTQLKQLSTRTHNICCAVSIARQCLTLCNPTGCSPPGCMGFSKQEYWSGEPCPPPGIFLTQGSNLPLLCPLHWQVDSLPLCPLGSPHIICETHSVVSNSWWPHRLYSPWNSPGQNTGVGSHSLLQGIFKTQVLNPGPLHCRWILYQLSHKGSPGILEWVVYSFSSGSSQLRIRTRVSWISGRFFTN